jgi:hypothetical protein
MIEPALLKILEHKSDVLECVHLVQIDVSRAQAEATHSTVRTGFRVQLIYF